MHPVAIPTIIMISCTIALAIFIPQCLQSDEPIVCHISYVTHANCTICDMQIREINRANLTCVIPVLDSDFRYYGLLTMNRSTPFWIFSDGKMRDDLLTAKKIMNLTKSA